METSVAENDRPQCKVCYNFLPDRFKDFNLCARCYFEAERRRASRLRFHHPRYSNPLQALEEDHGCLHN